MVYKLSLIFILITFFLCYKHADSQGVRCYECNSSWPACGNPPNFNLMQYTRVTCTTACATWINPNDRLIYRGCFDLSRTFISGQFSSNGVTYNVCATDSCNSGNGLAVTAAPTLATTAAPALPTTAAPNSGSTLHCYHCNSNWASCGNSPRLDLMYFTRVPCSGRCATWNDPSNSGILYRGCLTEPTQISSGIHRSNGITYQICSTELCNSYGTPTVTTQPATANPTTVATTTTVTTARPTTTLGTTIQSLNCYSCNSDWLACADPPRTELIAFTGVPCNGRCAVWNDPSNPSRIIRGCLAQQTSIASGFFTSGGITYNLCSSNLCNSITAPIRVAPVTQAPTAAPTAAPTVAPTRAPAFNNFGITQAEFNSAVTRAGYPVPSTEQYNNFVSQLATAGGITSKREAAMFLAQILWESDGLRAKREYACMNSGCPNVYGSTQFSNQYYGRGYIQLSWDYNYRAASADLFGNDILLRDPDMVARDDSVAWATALWYWRTRVAVNPDVKNGRFGASTRAINGFLECGNGAYVDKARIRFNIYRQVLQGFNINETPIEGGCYN